MKPAIKRNAVFHVTQCVELELTFRRNFAEWEELLDMILGIY
jgi:hypothetical protein